MTANESKTPRTDAFPTALIERCIHDALHPKGMSTHSGKVLLDCSQVDYVIKRSRAIELELNRDASAQLLRQQLTAANARIAELEAERDNAVELVK